MDALQQSLGGPEHFWSPEPRQDRLDRLPIEVLGPIPGCGSEKRELATPGMEESWAATLAVLEATGHTPFSCVSRHRYDIALDAAASCTVLRERVQSQGFTWAR